MATVNNEEHIEFQLVEFYTENIFEKIAEKDVYDEIDDNLDDDEEEDDVEDSEEDSEEDDDCYTSKKSFSREYKIYLFGRTADNQTVSVQVNKFTPYFYVEIPGEWNAAACEGFKNWILSHIDMKLRDGLLTYKTIRRKAFSGFSSDKKRF